MCLCEVSILIKSDHDRRIVFLCQFCVVAGENIYQFWKSSKAILENRFNPTRFYSHETSRKTSENWSHEKKREGQRKRPQKSDG